MFLFSQGEDPTEYMCSSRFREEIALIQPRPFIENENSEDIINRDGLPAMQRKVQAEIKFRKMELVRESKQKGLTLDQVEQFLGDNKDRLEQYTSDGWKIADVDLWLKNRY